MVLADPGRDRRRRLLLARAPARPPALSRLAHTRAALAARLWLQAQPAYAQAGAWWRSERRIRAGLPSPRTGTGHVADAEVHWPSVRAAGPYAGQVWAVEVELTPKPEARTARIMAGLLSQRYAQVIYLVSPAARPVVAGVAAALPAERRGRVAVRDLPPQAFLPGQGP